MPVSVTYTQLSNIHGVYFVLDLTASKLQRCPYVLGPCLCVVGTYSRKKYIVTRRSYIYELNFPRGPLPSTSQPRDPGRDPAPFSPSHPFTAYAVATSLRMLVTLLSFLAISAFMALIFALLSSTWFSRSFSSSWSGRRISALRPSSSSSVRSCVRQSSSQRCSSLDICPTSSWM